MDLILVRYAEIGLKGAPVRRRFERKLVDNIIEMLAHRGVEAIISSERGRVYVESDQMEEATVALTRVFGVASVSTAIRSSADLEEVCRAAARYSLSLLDEGDSFAIRARREGVHPFTSIDVAREVGAAVMATNSERGVHVDLSRPDVEIFVEVRGAQAFIFSESIPGPGGLPMGTQGEVVVEVVGIRDCLAAWLMMKRGCETIIALRGEERLVEILREWAPSLRWEHRSAEELIGDHSALAAVYGDTLDELEVRKLGVPCFFPLVGMGKEEISERLARIL